MEIRDTIVAQRIDALFARWTVTGSPGAAVGVMQNGRITFFRSYGLANVEHRVPIGAGTRFRIASVTKQFTVTAALMLAAERRLELDAPIGRYLPELDAAPASVTVDQMMRNTSGLPDFLELMRIGGANVDRPCGVEDIDAAIRRNTHLNFAPGTRFLYSNTNFRLLGDIVAKIEGRPLPEVLAERIFKPLGMTRTALVVGNDEVVPDLATGYLDTPSGLRRAQQQYPHGGEGGLISCVGDLLIWADNYDHPRLLADLPLRLSERHALIGGSRSAYARGLEHSRVRGLSAVGHGGFWPGYRTEFLRIAEAGLTVVVIANLLSIDPHILARSVTEIVLHDLPALLPLHPYPPPHSLAALEGTWFSEAEPSLFAIKIEDGVPMVTQNGALFRLVPRDDGWLVADRSVFEFAVRSMHSTADVLDVELGADRIVPFRRLSERPAVPRDLGGRYTSHDAGAIWQIDVDTASIHVSGVLVAGGVTWPLRGVTADIVEYEIPSGWTIGTAMIRINRDASGSVATLDVSTARIKGLRFHRNGD